MEPRRQHCRARQAAAAVDLPLPDGNITAAAEGVLAGDHRRPHGHLHNILSTSRTPYGAPAVPQAAAATTSFAFYQILCLIVSY